MTSPVAALMHHVGQHLTAVGLPEPASVQVTASRLHGLSVAVQLHALDLVEIAVGLLAWADTLTEITLTVWRPASTPDNCHLQLTGHLATADGPVPVLVYSGTEHAELTALVDPGDQHPVPLGQLHTWATGPNVGVAA